MAKESTQKKEPKLKPYNAKKEKPSKKATTTLATTFREYAG
jgi:hypothetical protein